MADTGSFAMPGGALPPGSSTVHVPLDADALDRRQGADPDFHGPYQRKGDPPDRVAEGYGSMGITGQAKQISNLSSMVLVAAIACVLLTVLVAVMWFALHDAGRRTDALIQAQHETIAAQNAAREAQQRREDTIRSEQNALFERVMGRIDSQTASTARLADKMDGAMQLMQAALAEVRASRVRIEAATPKPPEPKEQP